MKFVKKLRDGEYTIENNKACYRTSLIFLYIQFDLALTIHIL